MEPITENILELPSLSRPLSIEPAESPKVPCATESNIELHSAASPSECITFIKQKGHFNPAKQSKLKNSLLASVGLLELANAGDFAANVWNQVPVPPYAIALMAIGGALALGFSYYAFKDARLSWRNILRLREERRYLRTQRVYYGQNGQIVRYVDSLLDVNFRETGTELVDRISMDTLMGMGAVVVGVGTFMAIGGANFKVWQASNLLSGYIGNAPCAAYGLANLAWSAYVLRRAHRHKTTGAKELKGDIVERMLKRRTDTVKLHATLNGTTGAVAGVASLVTATMWWGYVVLAPCIVSSFLANYLWRHRVGYDRPFVQQVLSMDEVLLASELRFVSSAQRVLEEDPSGSLSRLVSDPKSIASVIEFITKNDLFEDFCVRLLKDTDLSTALFDPSNETLIIDSQRLSAADDRSVRRLLEIARTCVSETGPARFKYRERYLLEALGCYLCTSEVRTTVEKVSESASQVA